MLHENDHCWWNYRSSWVNNQKASQHDVPLCWCPWLVPPFKWLWTNYWDRPAWFARIHSLLIVCGHSAAAVCHLLMIKLFQFITAACCSSLHLPASELWTACAYSVLMSHDVSFVASSHKSLCFSCQWLARLSQLIFVISVADSV